MKSRRFPGAKVERDENQGTLCRITDFESRPLRGHLRAAAARYLKVVAAELGICSAKMIFDKVVKSPLGSHILFQQKHQGTRVTGGWIKLDIDRANRVYGLTNTFLKPPITVERTPPRRRTRGIGSEVKAIDRALAELALKPIGLRAPPQAERVMFGKGRTIVPAWKVLLAVTKPLKDVRIYLARTDGRVLRKEDILKQRDARAYVFDPSPVASLNDTGLQDGSAISPTAYREVCLRDLAPGGRLDGPYVTTAPTRNRVRIRNGCLRARRGTPGFREAMVYFHIDSVQRYLQELGIEDVLARPIAVDVSAGRGDNSFFSPLTRQLSFGTGGVRDAEDGEIIVHEYGHAIQDAIIPGFGPDGEARAMGEGFGDYLAATMFADKKPARLQALIGSWDASAYSEADPPYLRRLDSNKVYPRDKVFEEHADGEIWSACLWEIRQALGPRSADLLILSHHYLLHSRATFAQAADALRRADRLLSGGAAAPHLKRIFERRGIWRTDKVANAGYDAYGRSPGSRLRIQTKAAAPTRRCLVCFDIVAPAGTPAHSAIMAALKSQLKDRPGRSIDGRPVSNCFQIACDKGDLDRLIDALEIVKHDHTDNFRFFVISWDPNTSPVDQAGR